MKRLYIFMFVLLGIMHANSQEISIVVFEGTVTFSKDVVLRHRIKYSISPEVILSFSPKSNFVIFSSNKIFEKKQTLGASMDYRTIIENMRVKMTQNFMNLMNTYQKLHEIESDAKGSVIGASRGLNDKKGVPLTQTESPFYPVDSAQVVNPVLELKWKLNNAVMNGRLMVIHQKTADTLYNQPAATVGKATLNLNQAGTYDWFIYSKSDKKKRINQTFTKLTDQEYKTYQIRLSNFTNEIKSFDHELQEILIAEFKSANHILE